MQLVLRDRDGAGECKLVLTNRPDLRLGIFVAGCGPIKFSDTALYVEHCAAPARPSNPQYVTCDEAVVHTHMPPNFQGDCDVA